VSPVDGIALPAPVDADAARIEALQRGGPGMPRHAAVREVETLFLAQLLKAMRRTVPQNDFLPRSPARDVYEGMFDRAVAESIGRGDPLGLLGRLGDPPGEALKKVDGRADSGVGNQKRR
jgi:Rod binding domain-containing protein